MTWKELKEFYLVPSVISLQCYFCNSNENKACEDRNNLNNFKSTCNITVQPYCRKINQIGRRK